MARTRWQRDLGKERLWRQRLRRWLRSGLTGRDFCRREHLPEGSFYAWKREIAKRDREAARLQQPPAACLSAAATGSSARPEPTDFVPVRVVTSSVLEVVVRSGQIVRVAAGFDAAHLRAVVAALEAQSC